MSGVRLVVVEDESLIRLDLVEMLTEAGYEVVGQAGDGEAAIELVRRLRPDLVLMDVKMPILDGISAAEILAEDSLAPIVVLTAFSQSDLLERALSAGVQGYVVKPFSMAELRPAIEVALARWAQLNRLREDVAELSDRLEARKLIDRAKAGLQARFGWDEPTAFAWLQRAAMDRRTSMARIARGVLEEAPPHGPQSGIQQGSVATQKSPAPPHEPSEAPPTGSAGT